MAYNATEQTERKLRKLNEEMDAALALQVEEQLEKRKRFEREETARIESEKKAIEEERAKISSRREVMENEIKTFMEKNKVHLSQCLSKSNQSLDQSGSRKNSWTGFKLNIFN